MFAVRITDATLPLDSAMRPEYMQSTIASTARPSVLASPTVTSLCAD